MVTISYYQFAERNRIRIAAATMNGRRKDRDGWEHDGWSLTLSRDGKEHRVSFRRGTAYEGKRPSVETVIQSLALDAGSVENVDDFEEWAEELGYDTDSRKAEEIYNACVEEAENLKSWLGDSLFAELLECEEEGDDPEPEDLHKRFDDEILPLVKEQYEQDGIADIPARSEAFNDWIDSLNKDGEISDWLAFNITHPASCER